MSSWTLRTRSCCFGPLSKTTSTFKSRFGEQAAAICLLSLHDQVTTRQVATTGYVGIGFSPNGGMAGSDVFIGWVGDDGGQVFGEDRHAIGNQEPLMDASQDFQVESGYQNDTHTVITFSRPWSTCDDDVRRPSRPIKAFGWNVQMMMVTLLPGLPPK